MEPLKKNLSHAREQLSFYASFLTLSSMVQGFKKAKAMGKLDLVILLLTGTFWLVYGFGSVVLHVVYGVARWTLMLMRGEIIGGGAKKKGEERVPKKQIAGTSALKILIA